MRKDTPSRTAYKVALNIVSLGAKPGMEKILPAGSGLLPGTTRKQAEALVLCYLSAMKELLRHRVWSPLIAQMRQGTSPKKLALSVALGFTFGCFPIIGTTTTLCLAAGVVFKLNHAALQAANYAAAPLQLLLLFPFFRLARALFGFTASGWGGSILGTVSVWLLLAPVMGAALYYVSLPTLRWAEARISPNV